MGFTSDLERIIREQFDKNGVDYDKKIGVRSLAASYLQMLNRRILPSPRRVHLSEQMHRSLGLLRRETDTDQKKKAADAWSAVFRIRYLMENGRNVNGFLTERIDSATGKRSRDGMLWDFGMHHLHLSTEFEDSGFAERSDYLLFAVVTENDAYFVDVRRHPKRGETVGWVQQELLALVQSNWPELIEPWILQGVKGDVWTDQERAELRRKNANVVTGFDGDAVAPPGGGMTAAGSSILCMMLADRLMDEIECHQKFFDTQPSELRSALKSEGIKTAGEMEFELVLLDECKPSEKDLDSLSEDRCLSKRLCKMGFAVVERTTRCLIVVRCDREE